MLAVSQVTTDGAVIFAGGSVQVDRGARGETLLKTAPARHPHPQRGGAGRIVA